MTENQPMESWRKVWREAAEPLISTEALVALKEALMVDDPRLIQGATTTPPPLQCVSDWPVEAACLLGYCAVVDLGGFAHPIGGGKFKPDGATVGEVEEAFARMCFEIDQRLGEPAGCRWLLNEFDDRTRDEMFAAFLPEVELALAERGAA